jgi:hypothetical protein
LGPGLWLDRRVDRRGWVGRADLRSRPHVPSRVPLTGLRIGGEAAVDRVADPALEAAQRGLRLLPRGDLALVLVPARAGVAQLGDRGHVDGVVEDPVPPRFTHGGAWPALPQVVGAVPL